MKRKIWVTFDHQFTFAATPPKRRGRWFFAALLVPLLGVVAYTSARQVTPRAAESRSVTSATEAAAVAPALAPVAALEEPSGSKVNVVVQHNDTIEGIFRQLKLSAADLKTVLNLPGVGASFKQLKAGEKMTVVHNGGALHAIDRRISETEVLSVTRSKNGFAAERVVTLN